MAAIAATNITINYDEIYETLTSGGCVWLYFSESESYEMIITWYIDSNGLNATTYNGDYLFPNGSYH